MTDPTSEYRDSQPFGPVCPECHNDLADEWALRCPFCDAELLTAEAVEAAHEPAHGFYVQDGTGLTMHIQGDPNMSDDTLNAIMEVGRLAMKMYEEGRLPHQRATLAPPT